MKTDFLTGKVGYNIILNIFKSKKIQSATSIYKKIDISFPYLTKVINKMVNADLLTKKKQGRKYKLFLTDKGFEVSESLKSIQNIFEGVK